MIQNAQGCICDSKLCNDLNENYCKTKELPQDSFENSQTQEPQKINFFRIIFHRLTNEQIEKINNAGTLPEGAKFVEQVNESGYKTGVPRLTWNAFNIVPGTQKIPAGYELKNDILGFTHITREGTKSIFYRN
jgi:hypothetical protein